MVNSFNIIIFVIMNISYKYRIYPSKSQKEYFEKQFGMCRFIYNWCLDLQIKEYSQNKKKLHKYELQKRITILKRDGNFSWLNESNSQSLNAETEHLESAFTNFFRIKKGFPKFKSKHNNNKSFTIPQNAFIKNDKLIIPKCREGIKIILHRPIIGDIKTCTISKTSSGKYYISMNLKVDNIYPEKIPIDENQAIGIDLGIKTFATLSNGDIIENPKFLKKSLKRLKRLQRRHSKKKKGSNNRDKSRIKLAILYEKVTNQRNDFLNKTSTSLIKKYDTLCLEILRSSDMIKNHKLAQALSDISIGNFNRMIDYKSELYGKNILRCGQFEPSSKMCSCGVINHELTLNQRIWTCISCGVSHNRDELAANNIKKFCFIKLNTVGTTGIQACGEEQ